MLLTGFKKTHSRLFSRRIVGDVLKNNILEDPVSSIVRAGNYLEEICERLKVAYGNKTYK